jgi:hypothetical protein
MAYGYTSTLANTTDVDTFDVPQPKIKIKKENMKLLHTHIFLYVSIPNQ